MNNDSLRKLVIESIALQLEFVTLNSVKLIFSMILKFKLLDATINSTSALLPSARVTLIFHAAFHMFKIENNKSLLLQ